MKEPTLVDVSRVVAHADVQSSLVLLDFDGTITTKDTLLPYLYCLWSHDKSLVKAIKTFAFLGCGALGLINSTKLKSHLLSIYLKGRSKEEISHLSAPFIKQLLMPLSNHHGFPYAQNLLLQNTPDQSLQPAQQNASPATNCLASGSDLCFASSVNTDQAADFTLDKDTSMLNQGHKQAILPPPNTIFKHLSSIFCK